MGWFNHQLADLGDPFWELGSNLSWDPRWLEWFLPFLFFFGFRFLFIFVQWGWPHHVFWRHKKHLFMFIHLSSSRLLSYQRFFVPHIAVERALLRPATFRGNSASWHVDSNRSVSCLVGLVCSLKGFPAGQSMYIFKQWKNLGCLGYLGDEELPNYVGIIS